MSSQRVNPLSTVALGGGNSVVGAGGDADLALRDGSDASYVILDGTNNFTLDIQFAEPAIPSGAKIKRIAVSARVSGEFVDVNSPNQPDYYASTQFQTQLLGLAAAKVAIPQGNPKTIFSQAVDGQLPDEWRVRFKRPASFSPVSGFGSVTDAWLYEAFVTAIWVRKPVVTVSNPTGSITNTSFPLTVWTVDADPDGGATDEAQVRIFSAAQYGAAGFNPATSPATAESGTLQAGGDGNVPTNWRTTTKLPGGGVTYRSYVRTRQNPLSNWSDWAYSQFTLTITPPTNPSSVTVTPEPTLGRMKINVDGTSSPRVDAVELERSDDGGVTWVPVRAWDTDVDYSGIAPVNGDSVLWDWEAPPGIPVKYRARNLKAFALGEWGSSDWVQSSNAQWDTDQWWIKHPRLYGLNVTIKVRSQATYTRVAQQGVFKVLNREDPVVISGGKRALPNGEITFRSLTTAERDALDALLDEDDALLLQAPPTHGWPDRWVRFGDLSRERIMDDGHLQTFDQLPWQQVKRPEGELELPFPAGGVTHLTIPFTINGSAVIQ